MKQEDNLPWFSHLEGYLLIPHELLHVIGFRLVGQRCAYRWGNPFVTPIGPMNRAERLVGMLFPFVIFFILVTAFAIFAGLTAGQAVREGIWGRLLFWLTLTLTAGLYLGTTIGDLRRAYLLIFDKPWYSWTPFDFFFWPLVNWNEVREKAAKGDIDDKPY